MKTPDLASPGDALTLHDLAVVPVHELRGLIARCSRRTLHARFLGCGSLADQLAEALSRTGSLLGLAARAGTTLIGVGSVDGPAPYELAILVEDRWQRRGIGTQLLTALMTGAIAAGAAALTVSLAADNTAARHLVRVLWPTAAFTPPDAGVVDAVLSLRPNTVRAVTDARP